MPTPTCSILKLNQTKDVAPKKQLLKTVFLFKVICFLVKA